MNFSYGTEYGLSWWMLQVQLHIYVFSCSGLGGWYVLQMSIWPSRFIMLFWSFLSSKIFCLLVLSIMERRVLKYLNIRFVYFSSVLSVFWTNGNRVYTFKIVCLHDELIPLKLWNDSFLLIKWSLICHI